MKLVGHLGRIALVTLLALLPLSCSGGGSGGGGRMFVVSCTLGCNNGSGGAQVSCGIVNTFVNQDVSLLFSEPVDLNHVKANPAAFRVIETVTGTAPPGDVVIDPTNPRRLIFRPELFFDPQGAPSFGFAEGASYQIVVPGTSQNNPPPYVRSKDGKSNESRVLCTITTDQGTTDPVPGKPALEIYVKQIHPVTGAESIVEFNNLIGEVASDSTVQFVFRDLMNLGTVVTPATGQAPFITIKIDDDGSLATPGDQQDIDGSYTFVVDENTLTTTAIFTPDNGFPSAGSTLPKRAIVLNIPPSVVDLVGNSVGNGGFKLFTPETQLFGTVTLPAGGEQFLNQGNLDSEHSSADWGESQLGRLQPGLGGGSGRLGDLVVPLGQTVTLQTSPVAASGHFLWANGISLNDTFEIGDGVNVSTFTFKKNPSNPNDIKRRSFTTYSLREAVVFLNDPLAGHPAWITDNTYSIADGDKLVVTHNTPGTIGNTVTLSVPGGSPGATTHAGGVAQTNLVGGVDAVSFGGVGEIGESQIVTNYDFQAAPGTFPPPITVADGVFEFARVEVQPGGVLRFEGSNPPRVLTRGHLLIDDLSRVDLAGHDAGPHASDAPLGQLGGLGGPGGVAGGQGADRPDNTGSDLETGALPTSPFGKGLENAGASIDGSDGMPVSGTNVNTAGKGGRRWPTSFAPMINVFGGIETDANCVVGQVAGPGGGGSYATDGGVGQGVADTPTSLQGGSNTRPSPTSGGDSSFVGLPAPGATPVDERSLDPDQGWLRGGASGAGGGAHLGDTTTQQITGPICLDPPTGSPPMSNTPIIDYRSHSAGGGGGSGGAGEFQAGRLATINGQIDVRGGDGGAADANAVVNGRFASPGGGGAGGGILLSSNFLDLNNAPNLLQIGGGQGGSTLSPGPNMLSSTGGNGGKGLLRAEGVLNAATNPNFFDQVASVADVYDINVPDQMDPIFGEAAIHWLTVDTWAAETELPASFSAGQSCWMKPGGNFFELAFQDDVNPVTGPFGWNMDLILNSGTHAYRGSTVFGGNSPQTHWGELFSADLMVGEVGAPIVVRFQGAQATGALTDPCNVDPFAAGSPIDPKSLTPWVRHPAELNVFAKPPNAIRFLIIFDRNHPDFTMIQGVTNLQILADPD